jgi:Na+/proline symporter
MHPIDWAIIGGYLLLITGIGLAFIKRASGSVADFFVSGRSLPWWIAGTSLVATSFAADTPLFVCGVVAEKGIAGNWLWWSQAVAWGLAVVFFARFWRRSGIVTDAEFIELRYGGRSGTFLRGFKAIYTSVIFSTATIAWVMLAMQKIVSATMAEPAWVSDWENSLAAWLGWSEGSIDLWKWLVLLALFGVAAAYTALSGSWGIVITDLVQLAFAMGASVAFAIYALKQVGGMDALQEKLLAMYGAERTENLFAFLPQVDSPWMPLTTFIIYLGVLWWTDCGGFAAQRMFSTRTEKDAVLTAAWYSILHFAVRPWPWIVVALVAMVYYPALEDPESGYPKLIMELLPVGFKGLVLASLVAAFTSTVDTHLNWNASYFVTDVYRRFIRPEASEKQCVRVSRWAVLVYALMAIVIAYYMNSIQRMVLLLFNLQVGIGLVLMVRWFWWRVNAWSEISAMVASFVITLSLRQFTDLSEAHRIAITALACPVVWVTVTLLTRPPDLERLETFYRKVRPIHSFWGPIAARCPDVARDRGGASGVALWLLGTGGLYAMVLAIGKAVVGAWNEAGLIALLAVLLAAACAWIYRATHVRLTA